MKKAIIAVVAFGAVLAATAAGAASVDEEIKAARAEIATNSVNRKTSCRYYMAWYRELCTEAEREAILDRNVAAHRRWIELEGKGRDALPRAELGKALAWQSADAGRRLRRS